MNELKCKFYKKQFLSKYCELFKTPCYGTACNFHKEFIKLAQLEQQLQTAKEELGKYTTSFHQRDEQYFVLKEENEKLKECFIPLNQKKYYCSKEVYNILEDTKNEWQMVSQLESERVMEIVKLKRKNLDLTQQNKQLMELISEINEEYSDDGILSKATKYAIEQTLNQLKGGE
jgi:chromosome segregation ATPase